jgi:hypothetical protein
MRRIIFATEDAKRELEFKRELGKREDGAADIRRKRGEEAKKGNALTRNDLN